MSILSHALCGALIVGFLLPGLPAQTWLETLLSEVQSAVASVSSQSELSEWKGAHFRERIDLAHYETNKDSYEIDFARENQWCATSVAEALTGVTRAASFYVPEVAQGALPALPNSALTGACRLSAIWYEAPGPNLVASLEKHLASAWGSPTQACAWRTVYPRFRFLERHSGLAAGQYHSLGRVDRVGQG